MSVTSPDVVFDTARLTALRDLNVLDTGPEEPFDRFTRLVTDLLDVPIALISFVDQDRQYFKSEQGLGLTDTPTRATPLDESFCKHAVRSGEPLIVEDARRSELLKDSLGVRSHDTVAYAGMPLTLHDGHTVGTLCAIDREPRRWSASDVRILRDLAAGVLSLIEMRRAVTQQTLYDHLTGLPNRALLDALYSETAARPDPGTAPAVIALGVDGLGLINAAFGVRAGDRVLRMVGLRLARALRQQDMLGRASGDVFLVVCPDPGDSEQVLAYADDLRAAISGEPIRLGPETVSAHVTVGIATADAMTAGPDLFGRAAGAMREAKESDQRVQLAGAERAAVAGAKLRLRNALRDAVARGEISVAYQPIIDLSTGETRGVEALARWDHPGLGSVSPAEFIPIAESTGEIVPIGEYVLRSACEQVARWRAAGHPDLVASVNISPAQLRLAGVVETVDAVLAATGLPGAALTLEITEGVLLEATPVQLRTIEQLLELGVGLALDDFGTGYSALGYLKKFPIDTLKIDRTFVDGIDTDPSDAALVQALITMAGGLDMCTIAEGIETAEHAAMLGKLGCELGQGYHFARPLPAGEVDLGPVLA